MSVSGDTGQTERALDAARLEARRQIGLPLACATPILDEQVAAVCEAYVRALAPEPSGVPPDTERQQEIARVLQDMGHIIAELRQLVGATPKEEAR